MNHLRVLRATLCWAVLGLTGLGGVAAAPDADHVNEIMFLVGDNRLNEALEHAHLLMSQEPEDVRGYYYFTWVLAKLDRLVREKMQAAAVPAYEGDAEPEAAF